MNKYFVILTAILLAGCGSQGTFPMMGGGNSGMMQRHHAQVPAEYSGLIAPEVTDESLLNGAEIYKADCQVCHGETGMGEGPAGAALDPRPAQIAHTTQMLADDLVFYRISEGGVAFQTAMPAWKGVLTDDQIWDVIAYIRALGAGNIAQIDQIRTAQQDAMLKDAVAQGAITQEQADTFRFVHTALEDTMSDTSTQGTMSEREAAALASLVEDGTLTKEQVGEFQVVHAVLSSGGFMP